MHKRLLLNAVLLIAVSWAWAQSQPSGSSQTTPDQQSGTASSQSSMDQGGQQTLEGCLAKEESVFVLTDTSGARHQLTGDTADLSKNVGKEIRVKGTESAAPSTQAGAGTAGTAGTAGAGAAGGPSSLPSFSVAKVTQVADKCTTK